MIQLVILVKVLSNYVIHIKDVDIKLYEGARHELTNETNRDEVHQDLLTWLDNHVASLD